MNGANLRQLLLDEDDFGHEMRVGAIIADTAEEHRGHPTNIEIIRHAATYTDANTGKLRQFDFRCRVIHCQFQFDHRHAACAWLAIECKNLHKSSPLIVCGTERTREEAYYCFIESTYHGGPTDVMTKRSVGEEFYKTGGFVGKNLLRAKQKKEKKDKQVIEKLEADKSADIYDGWSQALSSSVELAENACRAATNHQPRFTSLLLPIVVVPNGSLWQAEYDRKGTLPQEPRQADQCDYFVEQRLKLQGWQFTITHIHFVTLTGLKQLVEHFYKNTMSVWDCIFPAGSELMSQVKQ